jgi:hypothetical protein
VTDYSQNGWTAPGRSVIVTMAVPGTAVKLPVRAGPAGQLLVAAAARWNAEVEPLVPGTCWGYADRTVRGSATDLSNHASGTAIDLNAPQHPLGTNPSANFTPAKITAIRRIVASYAPCLRWGGDYTGRKDGMHLEVVASEAQCAAVLGSPRPTPSPTPRAATPEDDPMSPIDIDVHPDGSFRAAAICEAGASSSVVAQAWVVFGVTWGSADCTISFLGDDGLVMGSAGQKRGQVSNNRRLVAEVPSGAVLVTVEGHCTNGSMLTAAILSKPKP